MDDKMAKQKIAKFLVIALGGISTSIRIPRISEMDICELDRDRESDVYNDDSGSSQLYFIERSPIHIKSVSNRICDRHMNMEYSETLAP